MKTREYLDTAAKIVTGQRQHDYGDKYQNHENIAKLWSGYLDYKISAHDVAICMLLVIFQFLQSDMPDFLNIHDLKSLGFIFGGIFVAGILFTWLSTFFALRKYLRIKESEIYL